MADKVNIQEIFNESTAKSKFEKLDNERSSVLTRARDASALTIPSILPASGHTEQTDLDTPFQGVGARLVNSLANKINLALLPPNTVFFRLLINEEVKERAKEAGNEDQLSESENQLIEIEQEALRQIEKEALRVSSFEMFKHLVVTGNALGYKLEKGLKSYKLDQYVLERDFEGNVITIITKETKSKYSLSEEFLNQLQIDEEQVDVTIYTRIVLRDDTWYEWQEVEDVLLTDSEQTYKKEESPYIPLRWTSINGENYGRGLVEQYLGDFRNLEGLYQILVETAGVMGRTIFGLVPGAITELDDVNNASNGECVMGNLEEDITTLRVDKGADLQPVMALIDTITRRLEQAFLAATSAVRDSERTTLGEIRYLASDLEESLGGVYSVLAQEYQRPLASNLLKTISTNVDMEGLELVIVTGVEALGRNSDIEKLRQLNGLLQELGGTPEFILQRMNIDNYIDDMTKNLGLTQGRYIKTAEQVQQEGEQAQEQALAQQAGQNLVDSATIPQQQGQ